MLAVVRILLLALTVPLILLFGIVFALRKPRDHRNVYPVAQALNWSARILGVTVETQIPNPSQVPAVFISNHQSNFDLLMVTGAVQRGTVAVGKKSLAWLPIFGQLFWITGNILIDRANRSKAIDTISQVVAKIKRKGMSVWIFPEGHRSKGKGLLPFKKGAFHTAIQAHVPIIPVVCSSYFGKIKLNRWNNGKIIVKTLPAIDTKPFEKQLDALMQHCQQVMSQTLSELDAQLAAPAK